MAEDLAALVRSAASVIGTPLSQTNTPVCWDNEFMEGGVESEESSHWPIAETFGKMLL